MLPLVPLGIPVGKPIERDLDPPRASAGDRRSTVCGKFDVARWLRQ
jgi:hypothetical protein